MSDSPIPRGNIRKRLSRDQCEIAKRAKELAPDGVPTRDEVRQAVREKYGPTSNESSQRARTAKLLANPAFVAEVWPADDPRFERLFYANLQKLAEGNHPICSDKKSKIEGLFKAMTLLGRKFIEDRQKLTVTEEQLAKLSEAELDFVAKQGRMPTSEESKALVDPNPTVQ